MPSQLEATDLLQQELQDLRSMEVQADHVRWLVKDETGPKLDRLLCQFAEQWRDAADRVAKSLVRHGEPPDGRLGSLADGSYRGWLPREWLDGRDAARWALHEIEVLGNWSRLRSESVEDQDVAEVCRDIAQVMESELVALRNWSEQRFEACAEDPVDEVGLESFPASDPPSSWAGPSD